MTQEEKQLLIQDLCTRLPYEVKCNVWYGPKSPALNEKDKYTDDILETVNPKKGNCTFHNAIGYDFGFFPVEHVKPYLRPMSSMTSDEKFEYDEFEYFHSSGLSFNIDQINWLNKKMFDYRGLIGKGLALEALEGMYNIKTKYNYANNYN